MIAEILAHIASFVEPTTIGEFAGFGLAVRVGLVPYNENFLSTSVMIRVRGDEVVVTGLYRANIEKHIRVKLADPNAFDLITSAIEQLADDIRITNDLDHLRCRPYQKNFTMPVFHKNQRATKAH